MCKLLQNSGDSFQNQILVEIGIKQIDWMKEDFHLENIDAQCQFFFVNSEVPYIEQTEWHDLFLHFILN